MGTHYKGNKEEKLALDTWIKFARANNSVFNSIKPTMTKNGLTTSQFAVLETLLHLGPMSQRAIGEKLLRTSGNIVKVIDNLEKAKLIERTPDAEDRRTHIIRLTDSGNRLINEAFDMHVRNVVRTFSVLKDDEKLELGRLCKKLGLELI